jgi:hypothetical protein
VLWDQLYFVISKNGAGFVYGAGRLQPINHEYASKSLAIARTVAIVNLR